MKGIIAPPPAKFIKAWCRFNGDGVPSLTSGYNVSSITDLGGQGQYRVNFTNPIKDSAGNPVTDYGFLGTTGRTTAGAARFTAPYNPLSTSIDVNVYTSGVILDDEDFITIMILR